MTEESGLTEAQRERARQQRQRAAQLRAGRRAPPPPAAPDPGPGGFVREPAPPPAPPAPAPPAPPPARALYPECEDCARRFPTSYLLETFDYSVCDECRHPEEHALLTRTEAKREFLLRDADLDGRAPPLRALSRPNPHGRAPMRLYVRAAVAARARLVWGGAAGLAEERARRARATTTAAERRLARGVRALRAQLAPPPRAAHEHAWGPERPAAAPGDADRYERVCSECGLTQSYEKM